jgi:perosamine synthetase
MMRFPIAKPMVGEAEAEAVARAVMANEVSRGESIGAFENGFAEVMGGGEAISAVNGTAAIELAVRSLGLAGEHVVTGAMSCQATANALLSAGCTIHFADHDPDTWQVSLASIRNTIDERTRAIVVAHLYGATPDMVQLAEFCRENKLLLIEDCSQSFGARWHDTLAGAFGDVATFSFYGNKLITTGEGGMVWTRSAQLAVRARLLRNHGQDRPFHHVAYGLNWKMPNLLAALGVEQLRRIPELIAARRQRYALLHSRFATRADVTLPVSPPELFAVPFCFPLVLPGRDRDVVTTELANGGIETRPLFAPQCLQPYWPSVARESSPALPVAERLSANGFYLSTSPHLSLSECDFIAASVLSVLDKSEIGAAVHA